MKLSKLFASLLGLGAASSKTGALEEVAAGVGVGNARYLSYSSGSDWYGITPVHKGAFANFPLATAVPIGSIAIATDIYTYKGVAGARYVNTGTEWRATSNRSDIIDLLDFPNVRVDNNANSTTGVQAALDVPYNAVSLPGFAYGKGHTIHSPTGVVKVSPVLMSSYSFIKTAGPMGSSVWKLDHVGISAPTAMIKTRQDFAQQNSISPQPGFEGMIFDGDKANAVHAVHGYHAEETEEEKEDCPFFMRTHFVNFSGDGIRIEKGHKQIRGFSMKSIANSGWSFYLDHNVDSKITQAGFGRSLMGEIYLNDCASPKFSQLDTWVPGGFLGLETIRMISCRNAQFNQCEIEGRMYIEGGNSVSGDKTKFQNNNNIVTDFNLKVSRNIHEGVQYTGGGGSLEYDGLVVNKGAFGIKFMHGMVGYGQGDPEVADIAATPKYIFKFNGSSDPDYAVTGGLIDISCVDMLHKHKQLDGTPPIVPFKNHWSNDPARVLNRDGLAPGRPIMVPLAAIPFNCIPCDGRSLTTVDYPLLYLGMSWVLNWASGSRPATFNVYDYSGIEVPVGMCWVVPYF